MKAWIIASFLRLALNVVALWRGWPCPEAFSCLWAAALFHALSAYEESRCHLVMADKMEWCGRLMTTVAFFAFALTCLVQR